MFMNGFDLHCARQRFTRDTMPNRLALTMVVDNLRDWTDQNSDGWAYWPKPTRAASKAMELIDRSRYEDDIDDASMKAAVRPIRSFLTRQGVSAEDKERILRSANV